MISVEYAYKHEPYQKFIEYLLVSTIYTNPVHNSLSKNVKAQVLKPVQLCRAKQSDSERLWFSHISQLRASFCDKPVKGLIVRNSMDILYPIRHEAGRFQVIFDRLSLPLNEKEKSDEASPMHRNCCLQFEFCFTVPHCHWFVSKQRSAPKIFTWRKASYPLNVLFPN